MAEEQNDQVVPEEAPAAAGILENVNIEDEMARDYIDYSMSVIVGRALPDVRDGLKPVHRRCLYAMHMLNNTWNSKHLKSARIVGDVIGKYHPHGDTAVYDTIVRMAQDFSLRCPLVDGHGNFGSIDGDRAAAMRYTEVRMQKITEEMLNDLEKETVDMVPNYDETTKEPSVLPAKLPNLLLNGSSGIAVGMATNIPPHNLGEVINACVAVIDDPEVNMVDLMEHISGHDFPTGGIIMGRSGIRAAYATGKGKLVVRARTEFEPFGNDRTRIIVTELPYQVNKRELVRKIAEQVREKRLEGISDLRDESDRIGMRIVIELKKDANPQVVLNNLFKQTALQTSYGIIMLALVDDQKQPKILSLRQIIDEYLNHQMDVLRRRTEFDLRKARERAHLLEGLLIAQDNIDEVIRIIRSAYDDARERLCERFGLDEVQAQAILDMRLKALQGLDREKLQGEYDELMAKITYYISLLEDPEKLRAVLREELIAIRDKFSDGRKTEIQDIEDEIDIEDLIEEETCALTLSNQGYIKRMSVDTYRTQSRGGRGVSAQNLKEEDYVKNIFVASTHDHVLFFTDLGRVHVRKGYQIPEASRTARGTAIVNVLPLEAGESVTAVVTTREFQADEYLMMVTRNGTIKRIPFNALKTNRKGGIRAITLDEGDHLINVIRTKGDDNILIATAQGMAICFNENDARPMGRDAVGVRGIALSDGDYVVGAEKAEEGKQLLTVTEKGYGKRTELSEYLRTAADGTKTAQQRGGKGLKNYNITDKTGLVAGCRVVSEDDDVMLIENGGVIIRIRAADINVYKRDVQGVIVMRIEDGNQVVSVERIDKVAEEA